MFSKVGNIRFSETWSRENRRMGVVGSVISSCIREDSLHFCLFQYGLPTESKPPSGTSTGCRCLSVCSTMDFHELQGHILTHHGLHYGLQGSVCPVALTPTSSYSHSFFSDLGVCRVVSLPYSHFCFLAAGVAQVFSPLFLNMLS